MVLYNDIDIFSAHEQTKSSTWRELTTLLYALKAFSKVLNTKTVICYIDSFAAVRIVGVGSPKTELQNIALDIFQFCLENFIQIKVVWIPRAFNSAADHLSKYTDLDDWTITPEIFEYLDRLWGPFSIDRFANGMKKTIKSRDLIPGFTVQVPRPLLLFHKIGKGKTIGWCLPFLTSLKQSSIFQEEIPKRHFLSHTGNLRSFSLC